MNEIYRILDANFNRAREALRVIEDCGRFALNDPAITATAKTLRSELTELLAQLPADRMITSRDTPGDIGTDLTSPTEHKREDMADVVAAAASRLGESLRTIEEYSKTVAPQCTLSVERMRYNSYTLAQRLTSRLLVAGRMADSGVYAIISRHLCKGSLLQTARAILAGGARVLQLREKDMADKQILATAAELRELTDEMDRLLIINDRPDIAAIVAADGVHLGQDDLPISDVRRLLRPGAIVGRSTHTLAQAKAAVNEGADYIGFGAIFDTATKTNPIVVGCDQLQAVLAEVSLPVVAIGGITAGNVGELADVGAKCVAVSSAICSADDPKAATAAIAAGLQAAPAAS